MQVHAQQIGSKESALGAALARLDFHDHVATVIRITRNQKSSQALLRCRKRVLEGGHLGSEGIVFFREFAGRNQVFLHSEQALVGGLNLTQLRVAPIELFGTRGIGVHSRIRQLRLNLGVLVEKHVNRIDHVSFLRPTFRRGMSRAAPA